jgi:hypothetical protein
MRADDDAYVQGVVVAGDDGLNELHVCVGAQTPAQLEAALRAGFEELLGRHIGREDFGGRVHLVVLGEVTPQTPEVWAVVERIERELRSSVASGKRTTVAGRPLVVSVEYTSAEDESP